MEHIAKFPAPVDALPAAHGIWIRCVEAHALDYRDADPLVGHQLYDVVGRLEPLGFVTL